MSPQRSQRAPAQRRSGRAREHRPVVVITGSSGFIGRTLAERLRPSYRVIGLDLEVDEPDSYACDLTDPDVTAEVLQRIEHDHGNTLAAVVHLAAYFDFTGEPHPLYKKLNVDGTRSLLRALAPFHVERFVFASTMLVHRPGEPGVPITEDAPLGPRWVYPESKLAAEQAIRETRGDIPMALLRCAGLYTQWCQLPTLAHQIQRIYEDRLTSYVYAGDVAVGQSAVHLDDVMDAFERVIARRNALPDDFVALIGEPEVMGYAALQNAIGRHLQGEAHATMEVPKPAAKAGAWLQEKAEPVVPDAIDQGEKPFIRPFMIDLAEDHYELDIGYAQRSLGWQPQHRLRDALPRMLDNLEREPVTWYEHNQLTPPPWLETFARDGRAQQTRERVHDRLERAHAEWQWAHLLNVALGVWLMTSPVTLGYWGGYMGYSDLITGAAVVVFGAASLFPRLGLARWVTGALGLWLAFAPLVFWTESAAAYLNGSLVGLLVAGLAMLSKPTPGVGLAARSRLRAVPPGWDYCPSDWSQRLPIVALAFVGFFISRYLAAYQLGHIDAAWDPFFGDGTERVITSEVSEKWPVPDAGLGGFVYLLEILSGVFGSRHRWHTAPWAVLLFGFLIVPLGAVSIYFIIIQPIVIGTWCTLCLVAATAMLLQIPYSFDEIFATIEFLYRRAKQGQPWLRVLLQGDAGDGGDREPAPTSPVAGRRWLKDVVGGGVTPTWTLLASIAIGVVLMSSRMLFETEPSLAHSDHLLGALIITVAVTSFAEIVRPLRLVNVLFGGALIAAPFLLDGGGTAGEVADIVCGIVLIALSIPRGTTRNRYGFWDRYLI